MLMKKHLSVLLTALSISACISAQTQYSHSSVRCMGVELDGSQTLRVSGYGRNRADAKEQAMKNAVWAVVFNGIRDGVQGCNMRPLVPEANAREKYEDYFNQFFSDKGAYKEYVSMRDTKKNSGVKEKDTMGYSYELTVRVLRAELKARLTEDKIINK